MTSPMCDVEELVQNGVDWKNEEVAGFYFPNSKLPVSRLIFHSRIEPLCWRFDFQWISASGSQMLHTLQLARFVVQGWIESSPNLTIPYSLSWSTSESTISILHPFTWKLFHLQGENAFSITARTESLRFSAMHLFQVLLKYLRWFVSPTMTMIMFALTFRMTFPLMPSQLIFGPTSVLKSSDNWRAHAAVVGSSLEQSIRVFLTFILTLKRDVHHQHYKIS